MVQSRAVLLISCLATLLFVALAERAMHPEGALLLTDFVEVEQDNVDGSSRSLAQDVPVEALDFSETAILVTSAHRRVFASYCSGPLGGGPERLTPALFKEQAPHYFSVPGGFCVGSRLSIDIENPQGRPEVGNVYVGEADALGPAFRWRRFFGVDLVIIAAGIALISSAFALATLPLAPNRRLVIVFSAWMVSCFAANVRFLGPYADLSDAWVERIGTLLLVSGAAIGLIYAREWAVALNRDAEVKRLPLSGLVLVFVLFSVIKIATFGLSPARIDQITSLSLIAVAAGTVIYLLRPTVRQNSLQLGLLGCAVVLIAVDGLRLFAEATPSLSVVKPTVQYTAFVPNFLSLAFLCYVMAENRWVERRLSFTNAQLHRELRAREEEVKTVYAEREAQAKEASILRERQRIMEDIHDGFGGRLLALYLQAQEGSLSSKSMANGLQDSLQDLRLIVDSMDTADGDLELALGALRGRVEPELAVAGIALDWSVDLGDHDHGFGPREVLALYRIIQEAVTNAIRHAQAERVSIEITATHTDEMSLRIADDGVGFAELPKNGRGLQNIRNRVTGLDGTVEISGEQGLELKIRLPFKR
ncbi:MAG: ATP-binding protein [Pseudomonadota bacterium]